MMTFLTFMTQLGLSVCINSHKGNISTNDLVAHDAAPFLPWHRYFIHLYELALREDCGYNGVMT